MTERILMTEFKDLANMPWLHVSLINDNVFKWKVALIVLNKDSLYYGGYFVANMTFPKNYPYSPPDFRFTKSLYHPNVYEDGRLCISILHAPGEDEMSGESASIRWSPVQRVESVLISVISLLDDANIDSPANVDASVLFRDNPAAYKEMVVKDLEASKKDIPKDFIMPTTEAYGAKKKEEVVSYVDDWADSDGEFDFDSGSDDDESMEVNGVDSDAEDEED
ncbi:putative ubiquitin conjugating enzyme [Microthyrium microscopicum]|uniref:Ubiquitin-conjugating enzyme E2 2 n=1 Tax=Microthyrium microscopicum TaxID=703497 RepID=A0A6A6U557_9PEZI|nr:putative ubiquitin conjugating enzyme [Microthyrium microscopicum]